MWYAWLPLSKRCTATLGAMASDLENAVLEIKCYPKNEPWVAK
jgi:hypothetical protein